MPMVKRLIAIIALLLTGCATKLTVEGSKVLQLEKANSTCVSLGKIEEKDILTGKFESVKNRIRNRTAEIGGNAFVIEYVIPNQQVPIIATAYKCAG